MAGITLSLSGASRRAHSRYKAAVAGVAAATLSGHSEAQ